MPVGKQLVPRVIELRASGLSTSEIAEELGVTKQAVSSTLTQPDVSDAIKAHHDEIQEVLQHRRKSAALEAFDCLLDISRGMVDPETGKPLEVNGHPFVPASVRRQAASDILDRVGVTKETALRVEGNTGPTVVFDMSKLTDEQLNALSGEEEDEC